MAIGTRVKCVVCKEEKKEANHWFMVKVRDGEVKIRHFVLWAARAFKYEPVCGERCVSKRVSAGLQEISNGYNHSSFELSVGNERSAFLLAGVGTDPEVRRTV